MSTSNCPACGSSSFYSGVFGPNCIKPGCVHFKNGTYTRTDPTIVAAAATYEWRVGELVYVNQMAGWGHPQGKTWMCAVITDLPDKDRPAQYTPLYVVKIQGDYPPDDPNIGGTIPAGRTWFTSVENMRRDLP